MKTSLIAENLSAALRPRLRLAVAAACVALGLAWRAQARADLFADNDARRAILDLRAQVATLQQASQSQAQQVQQIRNSLLDLSNQIDQIKGEMAQLRGQQDTTTRQLNDTIAKVAAGQKDLSQRLAPLEPVSVQIDGQAFTVQPAEKSGYEHALGAFRNSDFAGASTAFKAFLDQYPASPYAPEARYWLANSLFGQQKYREAEAAFKAVIDAGDATRTPQAMLGLANAQVELHELRAARATLHKLAKAYPASNAGKTAKERLQKLR